jgi:hypothetical protein
MKRIAVIGITALLLWALVPGLGEILENAVHLAQEGHSAHAAADGDYHQQSGAEHGCTGTVHLCSCCVSLSFLPTQAIAQDPDLALQRFIARTRTHAPAGNPRVVYHPPRV